MKTTVSHPKNISAAERPGQTKADAASPANTLAWSARRKQGSGKKPLVRRLVESSWITGLAVAALCSAGCEKKKEAAEATAATGARAENGAVVFPAGSPQLASVSVEPVETTRTTKLRVHGRLVWDENVTARVFTPFAGRVTAIPGEVGKAIEKGSALAMIASPDFGQAQADVRRAASDVRQAERTLDGRYRVRRVEVVEKLSLMQAAELTREQLAIRRDHGLVRLL